LLSLASGIFSDETYKVFAATIISLSSVTRSKNETLSEKLWKQVQRCYSMFEDIDDDGKVDYDEIIDDSKNGYLKVSGSWPTCGCNCENTIGAYKTSSNDYIFVKEYLWGCSWEKGLDLSDSASIIFPFDFEVNGFFQSQIENLDHIAYFYLDFDIPRKGTDTKVFIKPIPLGIKVESKKNIVFGYAEKEQFSYSNKMFQIWRIASKIEGDSTIENLLNNNFSEMAEVDKKIVEEAIGKDESRFNNKKSLIECFLELKHIYDIYTQINYDWLILGWNRNEGAFYIKEKGNNMKVDSFKGFLKNTKMWSAVC
jgi:hypothetical protein